MNNNQNPSIFKTTTLKHLDKFCVPKLKTKTHRFLAPNKSQQNAVLEDSKNPFIGVGSYKRLNEHLKNNNYINHDRKLTILKFGYRHNETYKQVQYNEVFNKIVHNKVLKIDTNYNSRPTVPKGTMNVTELWDEKLLMEFLGEVQVPKDRYKLLKYFIRKENTTLVR